MLYLTLPQRQLPVLWLELDEAGSAIVTSDTALLDQDDPQGLDEDVKSTATRRKRKYGDDGFQCDLTDLHSYRGSTLDNDVVGSNFTPHFDLDSVSTVSLGNAR